MEMRDLFPGYYRPTEDEFKIIWEDCMFIFDANALLNVYRYTPETRNTFLAILRQLSSRIWIPHQAAYEFHKNRLEVIRAQRDAYDSLKTFLKDMEKKIIDELQKKYRLHVLLPTDEIIEKVKRNIHRITKDIDKASASHPDLEESDGLRDEIDKIVDGNIGGKFTPKQMEEITKQGKVRYENDVPPGYKDKGKSNNDEFGDLILWKQIIEKAKSDKKPVLFITDDRKEDWWFLFKGKHLGPRPELVNEIMEEAAAHFYMYRPYEFLKYAQQHLNRSDKKEVLDEVRDVSETKGATGSLRATLPMLEISAHGEVSPPASDLEKQSSRARTLLDVLSDPVFREDIVNRLQKFRDVMEQFCNSVRKDK